ncbi:hypothetical protein ACLOJK_031507 [Asimina triloba]
MARNFNRNFGLLGRGSKIQFSIEFHCGSLLLSRIEKEPACLISKRRLIPRQSAFSPLPSSVSDKVPMDSANTHLLPPIFAFLCSTFFLHLISAATDISSYSSPEVFRISCSGQTADLTDSSGLKWTSDYRSKYLLSSSNTAVYSINTPSSVPQIPYGTARIFHSQHTYSFPVSAGRKFIRLYFYPANYSGLDAADALFNVTSGRYTLLGDFSSYNTTKAMNFDYLVREFSVYVDGGGFLNITFTPSREIPNAYAFANGIEVVAMPDVFPRDYKVVLDEGSLPQTFPLENETALQTVVRLNVGGRDISADKDSGLFRTWNQDDNYIYGAAVGVTFGWDLNKSFEYTQKVPSFIAPQEVYQSGRSMGPDIHVNLNYNLTWIFPIDYGFRYLVRLHFCETQSIIYKENQRMFEIFIYNKTAEVQADVISWANEDTGVEQNGVPVYRDYTVSVPEGAPQDLWLELHPQLETKTEYFDALLNGAEIFKLSGGDFNLAGRNPLIPEGKEGDPDLVKKPSGKSKNSSRTPAVVGAAVGAVAVVALGCLACAVFHRRWRQRKDARASGDGPSGWVPISPYAKSRSAVSAKTATTTGSHTSSLPSNLCRHFSFAEIKKATNDLDEALVIGVGGFGKVYRGAVDGGATQVAIKRANPLAEQGLHEFQTEIEMLSKLRHRHLVSLIGYCDEDSEMILVYDYMARGTLRSHLYKSHHPPLTWKQRLEICIGAARGLHYLHTEAKHTIIHRDVKTTNILLDENWVAKVSDFGLSKVGPTVDNTHVSTMVKGSLGYLDPEYFRRQQLTDKSDVYSFGVVLFEVLCARPAVNTSLPRNQVSLADWALHCQKKGLLEEIIDPRLKGKITQESLKKFGETAEKCLADSGVERPAMGDVLWNLKFAMQLQESAEVGGIKTEENEEVPLWETPSHSGQSRNFTTDSRSSGMSMSIGGRSLTSEDTEGLTPSAVFSQIMNPNGR